MLLNVPSHDMEKDFYITEYMSYGRSQMNCTIKKFCSDFIVNEITPDGTAERFVLEVPLPYKMEIDVENEQNEKTLANLNDIPTPEGVTQELISKIDALVGKNSDFVEISVKVGSDFVLLIDSICGDIFGRPGMEKEKRTVIHEWIRNRYSNRLDSQTIDTAIRVFISDRNSRKRKNWQATLPDYIHFTLCKENKDTQFALSTIAKVKVSSFGICGTKDRRAITTQRVSLYRFEIERLKKLNAKLHGIKLADFTQHSTACKLGSHWGNKFKVILRDVQFEENDLLSRIEDLKANGFINYFGSQRFGSCGINTAAVGIAILKRQWEVAVKEILRPRVIHGNMGEALDVWNASGKASEALKKLVDCQIHSTIEGQVLSSLNKDENNYCTALMKLARNTRSFYVHAYQSLLWNRLMFSTNRTLNFHVASQRVKIKGTRPVAGDLNIQGQKIEDFVNEEVALPLISGSQQILDDEVRGWYEEMMTVDGVTTDMEYAIGTVMRPLIVKPRNLEYKILTYPKADTRLHADLERDIDSESIGTGDFQAIALEFLLPSGSYATVALREITRCDMSKLSQISMAKKETDFLNVHQQRRMRLSVKGPNGRLEVFENVGDWSFFNLREAVIQRFNLTHDFVLYFGSCQLPINDSKLVDSSLGLVTGDRLKLVVNETNGLANKCGKSVISSRCENSELDNLERNETVFEVVLEEMKNRDFKAWLCIKRENDDTRWTFLHPHSVLIVEIDFRVYNDRLIKYIHATASINHSSRRRFLDPVILEENSSESRKKIIENLVSPIELALLGPTAAIVQYTFVHGLMYSYPLWLSTKLLSDKNTFLRLLGNSAVAECLLKKLNARSILRLEITSKYALEICRSEGMNRIWKLLYEKDFGKNLCLRKEVSYREAYKKMYMRHVRERDYLHDFETSTHLDVPVRGSFPYQPYRPLNPDPDMPQGPFQPVFHHPFTPPANPFPLLPRSRSPFDPFSGRELLPSRPVRPSGVPRILPRGPHSLTGNNPFDTNNDFI
ncbi:unnamed protein product [Thelazia callipaeda]|uniref:TRUD domain-containing protein n=1 Tax=Thelazia callipaeda TaxID=103827 RepID=A0A0N5D2B1_THECL|nr:unnamed protein product [Thelazia callipaeda]